MKITGGSLRRPKKSKEILIHECRSTKSWDSPKFEPLFFLFRLEILITCKNPKMVQVSSSENPEMARNSDNICLEFHFSSNFRPSQDFDMLVIFRVEIKEKLNCSNFWPSQEFMHMPSLVSICFNDFWTMPGTLLFDISFITNCCNTQLEPDTWLLRSDSRRLVGLDQRFQ